MIIWIFAIMDAIFMMMYWQDPIFKAKIDASTFFKCSFWYILFFNIIKGIIALIAYTRFKAAFLQQHGHLNAFNRGRMDDHYQRGGYGHSGYGRGYEGRDGGYGGNSSN